MPPASVSGTDAPALQRGILRRWSLRAPVRVEIDANATLVQRVLAARGLTGDAERFLHPSLTHLHPPSDIPGIDTAAERVLAAARAREPIAIYGDYDVDGVAATTILYRTIRALEPDAPVRTYIPHRVDEGYGLNDDAIRQLADEGVRVIITVDCGITAIEPARVARSRGVDLIITDHHNPGDTLPEAFALVHPRLPGGAYPFGDLCGAGVAYKLAWRLTTMHAGGERLPQPLRDLLLDLLPIGALAAIADVVPLLGENRVITHAGLRRIRSSPFVGLRALIDASGFGDDKVDSERVAFSLAPRLNACGRMGHAREAVELLTTDDPAVAERIADRLTRQNKERQDVERRITAQAEELAHTRGMTRTDTRAIVLSHPDWHTGVVGIACARLVERFARPVILMRTESGACHGSGRSVRGFSLHGALRECGSHLESFGGHEMAAGLRLRESALDAFTAAFVEHANRRIAPDDLVLDLDYDCDASIDELQLGAVRELERLAPFGHDNPPVALRLIAIRVAREPRRMGDRGRHLSLSVRGAEPKEIRLVAWNWGDKADRLRPGMTIDAVVRPKLNHWNGTTSVEAELLDVCVKRSGAG
ncbi:MAG: single-stranded-DNA-specific exonuclease RecJ [Phycisphaerales bacterium]|nr:single-stranded-DNA-specific exonuclease RecJ [Phycisphaerales bacterium]